MARLSSASVRAIPSSTACPSPAIARWSSPQNHCPESGRPCRNEGFAGPGRLPDGTIVMDMEGLGMECRWRARDVWRQAELGVFAGRYERRDPGHATHLVKFTPLSCGHLREGMDDIRDNA